MHKFSDNEINNCLVGPLISTSMVKDILAVPEVYVNGRIDTEKFSSLYHQILDLDHRNCIRENADWSCGYLTADNLNSIIDAD